MVGRPCGSSSHCHLVAPAPITRPKTSPREGVPSAVNGIRSGGESEGAQPEA